MKEVTKYLSIPELARQLGLSRDAVYKKVRRGEIDGAKVGCNFAVNSEKDKYISIAQLAKQLGISRIAVYKRIKKGQIEAIKVGRNHLIRADYLEAQRPAKQKEIPAAAPRVLEEISSKGEEKLLSKSAVEVFKTGSQLSIPELAAKLGITRDAVYKRVRKGKISASKVGRNFATDAQEKEYISIPQLAEVLGISRVAVYKQVKKGQIAATKVGRNHLISVEYLIGRMGAHIAAKIDQVVKQSSRKGRKDT